MYDMDNTDGSICKYISWYLISQEIVISLAMVQLEPKHVGDHKI
jgi:hypothetical protein